MAKNKQLKVDERSRNSAKTIQPIKMTIYKPIPRFKGGCKNC